jgi:hypothetical protein
MRFDLDRSVWIIDEGRELPVVRYGHEDHEVPDFGGHKGWVQHFRQVVVAFENRWTLSIIWGDQTYSANYNASLGHDWAGNPAPPFTDEPWSVEVGILMPEPVYFPAKTLGPFTDGRMVDVPERTQELWGDPLGYVSAEQLWWLAMDEVSKWSSDTKPIPEDGPYIHAASETGPFMLTTNEYATEKEER